jgi:hypothetical protein
MIDRVPGISNAPPTPCEDDEACKEHPLAPVAIAEDATGQQQRSERERVGIDDPLKLREPRAEIVPDRRDRHVHDGVVEHRHREGEAHREQHDAFLASVVAFETEHSSP